MKNFFNWFLVVGFFIILLFFLVTKQDFLQKNIQNNTLLIDNIQNVKINEQIIKVELALTQQAQEKGLSNRDNLKENEGMLFIFEKLSKNSFWMKDMNFPIDIIWIGENQKIIYIKENAIPELFPETYGPEENSKYVLEVNAGFSEKNNLEEGDSVEFLR